MRHVQVFLGFANFYRRFIEGYLHIFKPMTDTTKTTHPSSSIRKFEWTIECEDAFTKLKVRVRAVLILQHFDPTLQCIVQRDESNFAI